ncbi:MAG: transcription-repair coupling factor [Thermomicrobiales bacterium]|nr:transcription-repair coupling factor [Thermomicrobiales bacterium]
MSLRHLLPLLTEHPPLAAAFAALARPGEPARLADRPAAARPAVIAAAIAHHDRPTLIVTARADRADALAAALGEYLPDERQPLLWPASEALPYEQLPFDLELSTRRVALLHALQPWLHGKGAGAPPVVVAPVHGLVQLLTPPADLAAHTRTIRPGQRLDGAGLLDWAIAHGYQTAPLVQEPGTVARRGGIIDLFAPGAVLPVRIDLFGDEVETIRHFDPSTQRSVERLRETVLLPPSELPLWRLPEIAAPLADLDAEPLRAEVAAEWDRMLDQITAGVTPDSLDLFAPYLVERPAVLSDYFGSDALVAIDEPGAVALAAKQLGQQADELYAGFVENGELPRGLRSPIAAWPQVATALRTRSTLELGAASDTATAIDLGDMTEPPHFLGRLTEFVDEAAARLSDGWRVVVATDQVERLTDLFEERDIFPRKEKRRAAAASALPPEPGALEIRSSDANGGWLLPDAKLALFSDLEIFGFRKQSRRPGRRVPGEAALLPSLTPGEHVVHIDHGIARFSGLVRLQTNGVEREYMLLEYAKGDRLYVPVDQSDRVSRYSGGGVEPTPTRLGSGEWVQVKRRARRAVREMAFELIQLYASRETAVRPPAAPDTMWDHELAGSFPFTETPDQQRAIEAVTRDLEAPDPMDRLVCGDVGFGKTEVALRAAFKAVNNGRQVALLAPTTVLALQHFTTFSQRLAPFPVRVEMLSRLRNKTEQRKVLAGMADGSVDIVIGTHRLVQKDVRFKNLGLAIVDEEQRFGVRQKEALKRLRAEVDVLTMSATPIPRTLHMALAGIRDISIIDTPPQARLPIRTFVTEANDKLIREVLLREMDRGGQVYIVHNRVHDIDRLARRLRELVPEASFGVGHGQMDEEVLEEVILGFVRHDFDALISTTIIESGIDIPNVNTIVIDNADTLGLTQLYQLRGRVGRSSNRAYAYLLYRPQKTLSSEALERLEAIQEATELGAGLKVAMRDMEIRGAGNILGAEQSGHIAAIGYELYIRLLSQAVEEIRSGTPTEEIGPVTLDLPLTALIPADYVPDAELRLATYRRVAAVTTVAGLAEIRDELEDRFGPIPDEVEHLLALISLRQRAEALGIESVVEREREIVIRPVATAGLERRLQSALGRAIKVTPHSIRLRLPDLAVPWQQAVDTVLEALGEPSTAQPASGAARAAR